MESSTIRRKEREREARREAILEAARRVLARKGLHDATLDEIAEEAELSKGTLYNYYKDKQDLVVSLVTRGIALFDAQIEAAMESAPDVESFVRRVLDISLQILSEHRYLFGTLYARSEISDAVRAELCDKHTSGIFRAELHIAEGLARYPVTAALAEADRLTGARLIVATIRYLSIMCMISESATPSEEELARVTKMLCRALRP